MENKLTVLDTDCNNKTCQVIFQTAGDGLYVFFANAGRDGQNGTVFLNKDQKQKLVNLLTK